MDDPLLAVRQLTVEFPTTRGVLRAADGVSFDVGQGEAVALVGESGCGKSVTALSLVRLISPPGRIVSGQVRFRGDDLLAAPEARLRQVRGNDIGFVFQEPMSALNPTMRVGEQVAEVLRVHGRADRRRAREAVLDLLCRVGIPAAEACYRLYPHQLSGGMRQRVLIAMALIGEPRLVVADEPTTALDVTLQAQVLELLDAARRDAGMSLLLVTHDLALVIGVCHALVVLYAGRVVERGPVAPCMDAPAHPYTAALLRAVRSLTASHGDRLVEVPGQLPDPCAVPRGCRFADRCERARPDCRAAEPGLEPVGDGGDRWVRCHYPLSDHEEA